MFLFPASATTPLRLYLDESGTLGFGDEVFTMAMVLVNDLAKLEGCIARNKTTQSEIKASQMKTAQKLALARTLLDENDLQVFLLTIDPAAALACERKLDKELLYDSMIAQAMAYYLQRGELPRGMAYRLSLDMRGGIRESFEDMVRESIGNVLMHRDEPLVADLQIRYMDSKYSAGVQAADLFSNIYRTALSQADSPCNGFLHKYQVSGVVHAGFAFGLPQLADQMSQIAADLRARVELEAAGSSGTPAFRALPNPDAPAARPATASETGAAGSAGASASGEGRGSSRRRRRGGKNDFSVQEAPAVETEAAPEASAAATETASEQVESEVVITGSSESVGFIEITAMEEGVENLQQAETSGRGLSRSARRRRSRAARKAAEASAAAILNASNLMGPDSEDEQSPTPEAAGAAVTALVESAQVETIEEEAAPIETAEPEEKAEAEAEVAPEAPARETRDVRPGRGARRRKAAVEKKADEAVAVEATVEPTAVEAVAVEPAGQKADEVPAEEAKPAKTKRTRTRTHKSAAEKEKAPEPAQEAPAEPAAAPEPEAAPVPEPATEAAEAPAKPKRTRTHSRKAAPKAEEPAAESAGAPKPEPEPAAEPAAPAKKTTTRRRTHAKSQAKAEFPTPEPAAE